MKDRIKPLTFREAERCETAREPQCKCRCKGAKHGAKRGASDMLDTATFYEQLADDDPHHIPSPGERKELKHVRGMVASLRKYRVIYGSAWTAKDEQDLAKAEKRKEELEVIVLGIHPPAPARQPA